MTDMTSLAVLDQTQERVHADEVRIQLERIVASPCFKNSKRHTRFLRFVVEQTLAGNAQELKERVIGIQVFDRLPQYDLAADPVVRVAGGEMRKRLAQYYVQSEHERELRISLPLGSYVPVFSRARLAEVPELIPNPAPSLPPAVPPSPDPVEVVVTTEESAPEVSGPPHVPVVFSGDLWKRRRFAYVLYAIILLALIGALAYQALPVPGLDAFWKPVVGNGQSTLICVGDLNFLMLPSLPTEGEDLDHVMVSRNHVGPNDVAALARFSEMLGKRDRHFSVLLADTATLTDLRSQPAILIGAFDDPWTKRLLNGFRFQLQRDPVTRIGSITDSQHPDRNIWTVDFKDSLKSIQRDYALVARLESSLTGQTDIVVAGIGPYGTAAATEFLTTPEYFREFAGDAPKDWQNKQVEILLSTDVVDGRSAPPRVLLYDVH